MKIDIERLLCSLIECNTKSGHKYNWLADDIITSLRDQGLIYKDGQIIPELKESEDRQHRKWILEYLYDGLRKSDEQFKDQFKSAIAWLEKQGENPTTLPKWKYKNDNTPLLRDSLILNKYGCVAKSPSGALVSDVWVIDYDELAKLPKEKSEKQGEQKSVYKVEPKFKVKYAGSEYNVFETKDIAGVTYYGIEDEPNHIDYVLPDNCEIVSEQKPAWSEEDKDYYDAIITKLEVTQEDAALTDNQMAFLKTLKDRVQSQKEWRQDNVEELTEFENAMMHIGGSFFGEHQGLDPNDTNTIKEQATILLGLVSKQEWSEEDDKILTSIWRSTDLEYLETQGISKENAYKWIFSIKDRVQPQQKQEWSEEDEENLNWFEKFFRAESVVAEGKDIPQDKYLWFKNIKERVQPQNHWKPSEEMLEALYKAIPENVMEISEDKMLLDKLYQGLKYGRVLSKN